jgi:hypothetical protein
VVHAFACGVSVKDFPTTQEFVILRFSQNDTMKHFFRKLKFAPHRLESDLASRLLFSFPDASRTIKQ